MYSKVTCFVILVCVLAFGSAAQAQLLAPPINNPSFEATDLGAGGTGQWVDYAEEWIINAQGNCYLEDGSWQIVAPDGVATLKMWNGAAIWQQIGSWTPNTDYEIGLWVGRGLDTSDIQVELWAGGSPALVPDSGFGLIDGTVGAALIGGAPLVPTVAVGENEWMSLILNTGAGFSSGDALWLRIESTGEAAWVDNIAVVSLVDPALAYNAGPAIGSTDVLRDVVLTWTAGIFAQKHDVYFGTNLDDVANAGRSNPLDVLLAAGQDTNGYDVGRLEFGQTYFWRIDEVNSPPDSTLFKGDVWSFTVEPFAYPIPGERITAIASSQQADQEAQRTIDGSGLDLNDLHSPDPRAMWISEGSDPGSASIQYEFDKPYKLHEMSVWNYNGNSILSLYGLKEVSIEYAIRDENLTVNPSFESPDLGPGGTEQWADYVDNWIINTQGSSYLEDGTWDIVASDGVATLKMWNGAAIWQQIGNVLPNTDYEISLFIGRGHDTSAVQVELWAGGDPSALPTSYGIIGDTVGATLIGGAALTPTIETGQSELMGLSLNTGADFGPQDALWIRIQSISGDGSAAWVDNVMVARPGVNLTVNPSFESPDLGPGGTGQWADHVDNWIINNQGNCYLEDGSWDITAADGVAALKMWSGAAIWQQIGNVLPNTDYEISLFIGRGHDTSAAQVELWAGGDPSALPASYGVIGDTVGASLIGGAALTPTIEVGQSELMSLSLNTGADFGPQDALWIRIESISAGGTGTWVDNVMVTSP